MNFSSYIQRIFPSQKRFYFFLSGFLIGFILIMPHTNRLSKSAWLVIYGILAVLLGLCLYFTRPKEQPSSPNGWSALGLALSGILFRILSVFDWLICLNRPIAMILAGGIALLLCIIYTLWQTVHPKAG